MTTSMYNAEEEFWSYRVITLPSFAFTLHFATLIPSSPRTTRADQKIADEGDLYFHQIMPIDHDQVYHDLEQSNQRLRK